MGASPVSLESSMEDTCEQACVEAHVGARLVLGSLLVLACCLKNVYRQDNLEVSRDELDLLVLGQIRAHHSVASSTAPSSSRQSSSYHIHGIPVC